MAGSFGLLRQKSGLFWAFYNAPSLHTVDRKLSRDKVLRRQKHALSESTTPFTCTLLSGPLWTRSVPGNGGVSDSDSERVSPKHVLR